MNFGRVRACKQDELLRLGVVLLYVSCVQERNPGLQQRLARLPNAVQVRRRRTARLDGRAHTHTHAMCWVMML